MIIRTGWTMRTGRDADRHAIAVGKRKLANGAGIQITTTSPCRHGSHKTRDCH
jgi:hypothetical protein